MRKDFTSSERVAISIAIEKCLRVYSYRRLHKALQEGVLQEEQRILDEVTLFSKYNPQYTLVMLGKLMDMV